MSHALAGHDMDTERGTDACTCALQSATHHQHAWGINWCYNRLGELDGILMIPGLADGVEVNVESRQGIMPQFAIVSKSRK